MKKKLIFSACAIFIIISMSIMILFVLSGKDTQEKDIASLKGTWEVVASVDNQTVTLINDEFMVFDSEMVYDYKGNNSTPYASSKYKIEFRKDTTLQLPDISRKYVMDIKSDNCVCLYETPDKHICLIRYPNEDRTDVDFNQSEIIGKWDVTYRNAADISAEIIEFSDSELKDYRNGESEPKLSSSYLWENTTCLTVEQLNKTFEVHPLSDNFLILIETDTAEVWELQKSEN